MHAVSQSHWVEIAAAVLFGIAVLHTFSTKFFEHLAHVNPAHSGLWHLLGEVEAVFGFWAAVLLLFMLAMLGSQATSDYLDTRRFVEPMFVFVVMVICGSRPIMQFVSLLVGKLGAALPLRTGTALFFLALSVVPLLGSAITEPAAMTIAALILRDLVYSRNARRSLKYCTLGVLFVNVSIGGTLTHFAAPPVLMVASTWGWNSQFMFFTFGWKAAIAVVANAAVLAFIFRRELAHITTEQRVTRKAAVPIAFSIVNVALLVGVVASSHDPEVFMGLFLLFLGLSEAYRRHHDKLMLREGLMVAFFLAGLVVLGGQQKWWLDTALKSLDISALFYGAALLTAITDNAALTYLGSLVAGVNDEFKYALVAGAVAGGGLTVIANAPNPAGYSILKGQFDEGAINLFLLVLAALPPTMVAILCFRGLGALSADLTGVAGWSTWVRGLDPAFLFLLILPFAVAAIAIWNEMQNPHRRK